jgi:hypothetical protein
MLARAGIRRDNGKGGTDQEEGVVGAHVSTPTPSFRYGGTIIMLSDPEIGVPSVSVPLRVKLVSVPSKRRSGTQKKATRSRMPPQFTSTHNITGFAALPIVATPALFRNKAQGSSFTIQHQPALMFPGGPYARSDRR